MKTSTLITIILAMFILGGCAFIQPYEPVECYRGRIIEWQQRAEREGWTISLINDVISGCIELSLYESEEGDHWQTYPEFAGNEMHGDCEDIAVFILGTFKRLKYPHGVKVYAIRMINGDHAIIKVEVKPGVWVKYNTVPMPFDSIDMALSRPIFEFDATNYEIF